MFARIFTDASVGVGGIASVGMSNGTPRKTSSAERPSPDPGIRRYRQLTLFPSARLDLRRLAVEACAAGLAVIAGSVRERRVTLRGMAVDRASLLVICGVRAAHMRLPDSSARARAVGSDQ